MDDVSHDNKIITNFVFFIYYKNAQTVMLFIYLQMLHQQCAYFIFKE